MFSTRFHSCTKLQRKNNWERTNYPLETDDWETLKINNLTIALPVLYAKKERICPGYISKYNSNCETQVIFLMISSRKNGVIL